MKTTRLKNTTLIIAGAILTTGVGLYAATIDANINSFTQYIQQLFVTSDGTPTGNPIVSINSGSQALTVDGEFHLENTNGSYLYADGPEIAIGTQDIDGNETLIILEHDIEFESRGTGNSVHSNWRNNINGDLMTLKNDGSFTQTNPQTNAVIANDMDEFGFPAAGIGFLSGSAQGVMSVGSDQDLINIDIFGVNNDIGDFAGMGAVTKNDGSTASLIRGSFLLGSFHGIEVSNIGISHRGDSRVSDTHSTFIQESGTEILVIKNDGQLILPQIQQQFNYPDDTTAAAGGVPVGGLYHNSGDVKIRIQ